MNAKQRQLVIDLLADWNSDNALSDPREMFYHIFTYGVTALVKRSDKFLLDQLKEVVCDAVENCSDEKEDGTPLLKHTAETALEFYIKNCSLSKKQLALLLTSDLEYERLIGNEYIKERKRSI